MCILTFDHPLSHARIILSRSRYDLDVARTDNEVDMRYMINMDYSADLPINTMGRRIRTRLYFTSESHLHTVLNTFRYANFGCMKPLLSEHGVSVINATPELCYLTQIVIRVFEDNRRDMKDPRRFRIEILFSPGATSTPLHMHELQRDSDTTRFDTSPLQMIGREGLTCQEMEDFFEQAIMAGRTEDEDSYEMPSTSTAAEGVKKNKKNKAGKKKKKVEIADPPTSEDRVYSDEGTTSPLKEDITGELEKMTPKLSNVHKKTPPTAAAAGPNSAEGALLPLETEAPVPVLEVILPSASLVDVVPRTVYGGNSNGGDHGDNKSIDTEPDKGPSESGHYARKYFWSAVAVGSFAVGVSCLIAALRLTEDARKSRRWASGRRY